MAVNKFNGIQRGNQKLKTSTTSSQRAAIAIQVFRWEDPALTTLEKVNATSQGGFVGGGSASNTGNLTTRTSYVIDNDVIRCSISNNKGESAGTFSFSLKRGKIESGQPFALNDLNYLWSLNPGDWVAIFMRKGGTFKKEDLTTDAAKGLKMVGIIENVRYVEVDDATSGRPRLEYVVTGRSFGKVFDMNSYFNPLASSVGAVQSILGAELIRSSTKVGRTGNKQATTIPSTATFTPDVFVKALLSFFYGGALDDISRSNQTWFIPKELSKFLGITKTAKGKPSFIDMLDQSRIGLLQSVAEDGTATVAPLLGKAFVKALPTSGVSAWALMKKLSNAGINEMFCDLAVVGGKLKPALTVRQLPFSTKASDDTNVFGGSSPKTLSTSERTFFTTLPRYVINSYNIRSKNVGKSEFERLNHIVVVPSNDAQVYHSLYAMALNAASVQRHGLKTFQVQTPFVLESKESFKKFCDKCVDLLTEWFFLNHMYYNGTIITDGIDDHAELGSNLFIEDLKQLFHIEGYTHTYELDPLNGRTNYISEFRVSRGQLLEGSKAKFIGEAFEEDGVAISTNMLENIRNRPV